MDSIKWYQVLTYFILYKFTNCLSNKENNNNYNLHKSACLSYLCEITCVKFCASQLQTYNYQVPLTCHIKSSSINKLNLTYDSPGKSENVLLSCMHVYVIMFDVIRIDVVSIVRDNFA